MGDRRVYYFGSTGAEGDPQRKDILGGKGAGLAAMSRAGLPVPPGFTISTECCRMFLSADRRWPDGLQQEVRDGLVRLERETGRTFGSPDRPLLVSVRSGAAVSMPGMMDTILNCGLTPVMADSTGEGFWLVYAQFVRMFVKTVARVGEEDLQSVQKQVLPAHRGHGHDRPPTAEDHRRLAEALQHLYAQRAGRSFPADAWETLLACIEAVFNSWNNQRAITYRREHDVRGVEGTAVNVQSMFPSQTSGICFTANPNDPDAEEMIIESSYGLGEAVVSGDVHPDRFVVDRATLTLKRSVLGNKGHIFAALGDDRRPDADAASLEPAQATELARMCRDVEKFFGSPMDIEWGLADGRFALLQARPIRGLEVTEDVEIGRLEEIRRLKSLAGERRKVWVLHNLGETLPSPMPLTWDIVRHFMSGDGGFGRMYRDFGYRPSRRVRSDGFLELICGRVYADPEGAADLFWDGFPLSYDPDEVARNPKLLESAPTKFQAERATGRFFLALPGLLRAMLRCARLMKQLRRTVLDDFRRKVLPPYLEWVGSKRSQDLSALPTTAVLDELHGRIERALDQFGGESLKPGFFGGMAQAQLEQRLRQLLGPEEGTRLALTLTQGLEGDTTVEQNTLLYEVARGQATLGQFLQAFGHRAVGEMELSRPRWREDATYVRQVLSAYLDPSAPSPQTFHDANAARRRQAEGQLPETLRQWGGSCLAEEIAAHLAAAQALLPYRESGKHFLMMGYETIRLAILELARRWDLGRDIFFLRLGELGSYESDHHDLSARIAARKVRWQSARRLEVAEVVDSRALDDLGVPRKYPAASELHGEPIASGVASGSAMIVFDPQQVAGICTDYILVCPSTDPGWTALFVHARGLIVEQGGVLSHGAIVARDFGIPAVVCPDATRRIPDRSTVRLDGNTGRITLL